MSERRGDAELLCEATDGIATVTVSNPAKRNAMTAAMWSAFPALLDELAADSAVRVVILRGAGDTFCAGADLDGLSELLSGAGLRAPAAAEEALAAFCKPTIAAIAGYCLGGGAQLAVACDLRFAADDARFGISPAKLGVVYQARALGRLTELVGKAATKRLIYSAEPIDAPGALRIGLVDELTPAAGLLDKVRGFATELAARSQLTLQATKSLIASLGTESSSSLERAWQEAALRSGEAAEGMSAFAERRAPRFPWTGAGCPDQDA
jgi:enoyl-CoA hydratase/carnithine racemase